jgi:superfamily I DNA/RNA helicase
MAARVLQTRLVASGVKHAADVSVSAIRGVCRSLLDTPDAIKATGRAPRLTNGVEEVFFLEDLKGKLPDMKPADLREKLESLYRGWANLNMDTWAKIDEDEMNLQNLVESELTARQAMLTAELSAVSLRYLNGIEEGNEDVRIAHLLVDDFQDFSQASQAVCGLLFSETLTVAGNPCQTQSLNDLYPYPQGLINLNGVSSALSCDETIVLTTTLRCPQRVAAAGNALMLSESELLAAFDESMPLGCVTAVKWADPVLECEEITSWLKRRSTDEKNPLELGSVVIIVPNRVWGRRFSQRLDALKLPYEARYTPNSLRGNPLRLDASAGMRSLTLLTLAAHPDDAVAWRCWCGFGHPQTNAAVWGRLMDWAREQKFTVSEALRHLARTEEEGRDSPFEGSDLLVPAWRRAVAILERCQGKKGERLLGLLCEGNDPTLDDFEALVRPLDGTETALELYERASNFSIRFLPTTDGYASRRLRRRRRLRRNSLSSRGWSKGFCPRFLSVTAAVTISRARRRAQTRKGGIGSDARCMIP